MASPNELSFLPEDYLVRKARRRANILCASLSLVVLGGILWAFVLSERSMREVQGRAREVDQAYADAARRIEQVRKLHEQQRSIIQHAELAASLVEKVPRSNILAELTNLLPSGVSLLDFELQSMLRVEPQPSAADQRKAALEAAKLASAGGTSPAPQPAPAPRFDVHMHLTGVASTDVQVAQYIGKLTRSRLLRDVNLVITDVYETQGQTLRRFQIEMMLNPDAEVRDGAKLTHTAAVELQ